MVTEPQDVLAEREAMAEVRRILDQHIVRLGRYYSSSHIETFAREAIAILDAALVRTPETLDGAAGESWPTLVDLRQMSPSQVNAFFASVGVDWRVLEPDRPLLDVDTRQAAYDALPRDADDDLYVLADRIHDALSGSFRVAILAASPAVRDVAKRVAWGDFDALRAAIPSPTPPAFPDHTHRWQERSQETLDAEYRETGASLGRWHCPDCYTETDVEPDQLRAAVCGLEGRPGPGWGCGQPVVEVYRCTECAVPFHRECANEHFAVERATPPPTPPEGLRTPYGGHPEFGPRVVANQARPSLAGWEALALDALRAFDNCRAALAASPAPDPGAGLAELRGLSDAATPGPWEQGPMHWQIRYQQKGHAGPVIAEASTEMADPNADAELIVAAVNYVRSLLAPSAEPPETA